MSDSDKAKVRQMFTDVDTGRADVLDSHVHAAYRDHNPPPFASRTPGLPGMKETYGIALGIFSDFKHVVDDQITEGDRVATRITGSGRHTGPLLGIPATQKMVTMSGIAIHRVENGKLVEHWGQVDALAMLAQVGAFPAPPVPPAADRAGFEKKPGGTPLGREAMKQRVRTVFDEVMNKRNLAVARDLVHPAYVNYSMPTGAIGPEAVSRAVGMFHQAFPDLRLTIEDMVAEDDKVATRGHITGTHAGTFMNVPATGKHVRIDYIDIWHAHDGLLLDNWVQLDVLGALVQLGAMAAPGA